ncbi:MAG TPA: type II toxin-antitoxin system RelB/DinJ family antitoxin [Candidatus Gordonibacter avicola]|nr:type II toxin-antitoxin system RelB/DinJ family antitoxin [Candidatus Gordonibacter avicola]
MITFWECWLLVSLAVIGELGINLANTINAFLKQSVRVGGLPLNVRLNESDKETILAMIEAESLASDPDVKR